jgi:hypothetical protein
MKPTGYRRPSGRFEKPSGQCESGLSSTDQSDGEWDRLQARMEADTRMVDLADSLICDYVSCTDTGIENLPTIENVTDVVNEKQLKASQLTDQALDMQARFVWDLALAVKRMCVAESVANRRREAEISKIGVRDILMKLETRAPYPRNWMGWILQEFEPAEIA